MDSPKHRRRRAVVYGLATAVWPAILGSWAVAMVVSDAPRDWFGISGHPILLDATMLVTAGASAAALAAPRSTAARWALLNVGTFALVGRIMSLGLGDAAFPLLAPADRGVAVLAYCALLVGHVLAHFVWITAEVDRAARATDPRSPLPR